MHLIERYFAAWNDHDAAAIAECFSVDGSYEDPTTGGLVFGQGIARHAADLIVGFPDVSIEVRDVELAGPGRAFAEFTLRGTNLGPTALGPPNGQLGTLEGTDVFTFAPEEDRFTSVRGYWDLGAFLLTMGLRSVMAPNDIPGMAEFGLGIRASTGREGEPGCFTVTSIDVDGSQAFRVNDFLFQIVADLRDHPGYLGSVFANGGGRWHTFSAWSSPDDVAGIRETAHTEAVGEFLAGHLGTRVATSVWVPRRVNATWAADEPGEHPTRRPDHQGQWL